MFANFFYSQAYYVGQIKNMGIINNFNRKIRAFLIKIKSKPVTVFIIPALAVLLAFSFSSCQKTNLINTDSNLHLEFSNDSIIFDTVFTTLGSATRRLMVYNRTKSNILISDIKLEGGSSSPFRINIDGEAVFEKKNTEIRSGDSLYIFARVTIDPNNASNPFVVEGQLQFITNGNQQTVKLVAWGKNARYILADHITKGVPPYKIIADSLQTTQWNSQKPYVVYGYAVINSFGKLKIGPGTHIYFHKNSGLWVFANGQLIAEGTRENPIVFQGDRLEPSYAELPGQWDRIWIMEGTAGKNDIIKNAIIKNAFIGIQAESFFKTAKNQLTLENVIIKNMNSMGIFSRNYNISGQNLVIANCRNYSMALTGGGNYQFIQSTIVNYWPYSVRNNPAVFLTNYLSDSNSQTVPNAIHFYLGNSIIYGYNHNEFGTQMVAGADSNYFLDHCLIKTTLKMTNPSYFNQVIKNKAPLFKDIETQDYRLDTLSPAIGKGDPNISVKAPYDLLGNPRGLSPDLGAYQFVPGQSKKLN